MNPRALTAPRDRRLPRSGAGRPRHIQRVLIALILIAATAIRFAGIGWGGSAYLHPDERFMTMVAVAIDWPGSVGAYFDSATSPLNPYNNDYGSYLYGTLPLFLAKLLGTITGNVVYGDAHEPGRWLSTLFDVGTVALTFWIGRRLFSPVAGLIAAALLAFTPLNIQTAHYFTTDATATFFAVAAFAATLQAWFRRSWRWYALAGLAVGLAAASKPNLLIAAGFLIVPALEAVRLRGWRSLIPPRRWKRGRLPVLAGVAISGIAALVTFRVAQPYAFLGPDIWNIRLDPRWTEDLAYWRQVQAGTIDLPPGIQWADRAPFLFILDNLVRWGMGPALGLTALVSLAVVIVRLATARRWPSWWTLAIVGWILFHLVLYGAGLVKTQRYLLPAYPFLIVLAAGQLAAWADKPKAIFGKGERRIGKALGAYSKPASAPCASAGGSLVAPLPPMRYRDDKHSGIRFGWRSARRGGFGIPAALAPARILIALVILGTAVSGLALASVFQRPQTRIAASEWIYDNIPPGSTIATEYWDDGLPISLPGRPTDSFTGIQFHPYDADTDLKLSRFIGELNRADYIVLSSDRLIGSIPRMPDRYPMATAYYEALVSGALGFDLIAEFRSPPELFGIAFDDRGAEEALTVYDHPRVRIFRKTEGWSDDATWYLLDTALGDGGVSRRPIDLPESDLLLSDEDRAAYAASGTPSDLFDPARFTNTMPAVWWYLVLQLFALPAVPILWRLFPSLPDRGYALAKTIGVFGVAWLAWIVASLRLARFEPSTILVALGIAAGLGLLAIRLDGRRILRDLGARWRWVIATEAIFGAAYVAVTWLRMQNPDLWNASLGGEKPMELAIFNATLRSPWFPPYDPWFAGGVLHYYYFGYVPWAVISRLTGIVPEVAFNLAFPAVFALVLLNAWSAAAALLWHLRGADHTASRVGKALRSDAAYRPGSRRGVYPDAQRGTVPRDDDLVEVPPGSWRPILLALVAPAFVGVLGNLDFVRRIGRGEWGYPPAPSWIAPIGEPGVIIWGTWKALTGGGALPNDAFWASTRVIPDTINEFPYFTLLFGDLHAHLLAMPVVTAAIVVAAGIATSSGVHSAPLSGVLGTLGGWRVAAPLGLLCGLLGGILIASNTWDYPPATALIVGAAIVRILVGDGLAAPWRAVQDLAMFAALVLISGRLLFQPYLSHYGSVPSQTLPVTDTTRLSDYLAIHGVMLVAIGGYLAVALAGSLRCLISRGGWRRLAALPLAVGPPVGLVLAMDSGDTSFFLVASLVTVAACTIGRWRMPAYLLMLGMIALAFGLALFAETRQFANDVGRMNTVFKLSLHAWILLGIAAAVSTVSVLGSARASLGVRYSHNSGPRRGIVRRAGLLLAPVWTVALALLITGAAAYPAMTTGPRLAHRFEPLDPTLDGFAYMERAVISDGPEGGPSTTFALANDRIAIDWLRRNVVGTPVILEAQLSAYRWGGRISSTTGLPTVLGWTWHQKQQRPGYHPEVDRRVADVATIYGGFGDFASIRPLLDTYHVELIYVGDLERAIYGDAALGRFTAAAEQGLLDIVFDADGVTIYAYDGVVG